MKPKDLIKMIKKINRENQLERERFTGKPRAKSFGGRPDAKQDRRNSKKEIDRQREAE